MITIEKLVKKEPVYLDIFDGKESVISEFNLDTEYGNKLNILFAYYSYEDYNGDAYVLFEKEGSLFEVYGGHCSCNGLEDQWSEEEIDLSILKKRFEDRDGKNYTSYHDFTENLLDFLEYGKTEG